MHYAGTKEHIFYKYTIKHLSISFFNKSHVFMFCVVPTGTDLTKEALSLTSTPAELDVMWCAYRWQCQTAFSGLDPDPFITVTFTWHFPDEAGQGNAPQRDEAWGDRSKTPLLSLACKLSGVLPLCPNPVRELGAWPVSSTLQMSCAAGSLRFIIQENLEVELRLVSLAKASWL